MNEQWHLHLRPKINDSKSRTHSHTHGMRHEEPRIISIYPFSSHFIFYDHYDFCARNKEQIAFGTYTRLRMKPCGADDDFGPQFACKLVIFSEPITCDTLRQRRHQWQLFICAAFALFTSFNNFDLRANMNVNRNTSIPFRRVRRLYALIWQNVRVSCHL